MHKHEAILLSAAPVSTPHTIIMCKPQTIPSAKSFESCRVIRLSFFLALSFGLAVVLSFLAGCFVRVMNLPLLRDERVGSFNLPGKPVTLNISNTYIGISNNSETIVSAQYMTIEVGTRRELNEADLLTIVQTLELSIQNDSQQHLNFTHHCIQARCLAVSLRGHIAMYFIHQTIIINLHIRDYNYTSQYQQQRVQYILDTVSPLGTVRWSHKLRGFRDSLQYSRHTNPFDHEMGVDVLRRTDDKKLLVSTKTKYQNVDIYELPRRWFNGDGLSSQRLKSQLHPDGLLGKDKALYLDGVLQSSLYGDAAYHEALVHPGMIVHDDPKNVAIIGGGEGATLREVLKHNTVENVVMLEIDEELTRFSREHLTEWSDCGDIQVNGSNIGEKASCFDDSRVDLHFVDAFQWFVDSYSRNSTSLTSSKEDLFDVIIMDALDPDDFVEFADKLYNNTAFIESIYNGLSPEGVFVVQLGASPDIVDPSDENGAFKNRANMISKLQELGFESIHIYDDGHCDFYHPWTVLVALKDYETRANWYRNAAEIQIELHQRIHKMKFDAPALLHFDAATMLSYQLPSKSFESIYCRQDVEPEECDEYYGFWPGINNIPISDIMVQKSGVSEHAGRGIFAKNDIPEESMIDLEQGTKAFHMSPSTWDIFDTLFDWAEETEERNRIESNMSGLKYFIEGEHS